MKITTLDYTITNAKISMNTSSGKLSIQQPGASVDIRQPKAEMSIQTTPGRLHIDQSQAFAEAGRKDVFQLTRENAATARQKALEGTGRRAMEGRELADIHKGTNAIQQQAQRASMRNFETGIAWIPSYGSVKIDYQVGDVAINVQTHQVENNTKANKPIIHYQPSDVSIQMNQYPSVRFQAVNKTI
ncbi:DUF6470 family protein [Domibacillus indicus]|uniref:DUF6470 family protein n=1 Tax=Domibacillus indicus TaxID=1437523 RepID=UPI0006180815|nr:DUF6470 family protein [Domibacillus indicus]